MEEIYHYKFLNNGDMVKIINSKKVSPSLHWLSTSTTGKARAAIKRYWQDKSYNKEEKQYSRNNNN